MRETESKKRVRVCVRVTRARHTRSRITWTYAFVRWVGSLFTGETKNEREIYFMSCLPALRLSSWKVSACMMLETSARENMSEEQAERKKKHQRKRDNWTQLLLASGLVTAISSFFHSFLVFSSLRLSCLSRTHFIRLHFQYKTPFLKETSNEHETHSHTHMARERERSSRMQLIFVFIFSSLNIDEMLFLIANAAKHNVVLQYKWPT